MSQLYRDMHGFIVVCSITDLQSVRDVQFWLEQIEHRAQVSEGRQTFVLVNKIELLDIASSDSMSEEGKAELEIQEKVLNDLYNKMLKDFPDVHVEEISVKHGHMVTQTMQKLGRLLQENEQTFIR